jgi:predicted amidohydrolase YtcJ
MQSYVRQSGCSVSQWLRVGGVKAFADGSLGSRTALFHEVLIIFSFCIEQRCMKLQLLN